MKPKPAGILCGSQRFERKTDVRYAAGKIAGIDPEVPDPANQ